MKKCIIIVAKWGKVVLCEQFSLRTAIKMAKSRQKEVAHMSFVGSYNHSLDAKKRVFVPSKFREDLGDEFYITRKFGAYLSIYTADDWQAYVEKIEKLPESDAEEIQDFILGAAQKCTPDASGRIILDDKLMRHAGIDKNIVFVGAGKQIRIWAEEEWNAREQKRDFDKMRDIMRQYGL